MWEGRFEYNFILVILVEYVWEYFIFEEGVRVVEICYEFLKLFGYIWCGVFDVFF